MMYCSQTMHGSLVQLTTTKRKRSTCRTCGKEGHNASNKHFHPENNPNAKVGSDRVNAKSAPEQPTRNIGEIDDEEQPTDMVIDSEEEESDDDLPPGLDCDSDSEWGDEMLFWDEYTQGHDAAPVGPIEASLPPFKGSQPGPILGDALDMDPNDPLQAFQFFFHRNISKKCWPLQILMDACMSSAGLPK